MRLFTERSYDEVTAKELAAAAGVTEKTVFNHFAAKEDLVYPVESTFERDLLDAVRGRGPGVTVLDATRAFLLGIYSRYSRDLRVRKRALQIATMIESSRHLRSREQALLSGYAELLRGEIELEFGAASGDVRASVAADAIIAVHRAVIVGFRRGLLAGEPAKRLIERMRAAADEGFDLVAFGISAPASRPHRPVGDVRHE